MTRSYLSSRRARLVSTRLLATLGLLSGLFVGCADEEAGLPRSGNGDTPPIGGDKPSNGVVSVSEASISGKLEGTKLTVSLLVQAVSGRGAATGKLNVSLVAADGISLLQAGTVAYDIAKDGTQTLVTELTLPAAIAKQSEAAKFSVRVDDGKSSGLHLTKSLLYVLQPYAVRLEGPANLSVGKQASYRVRVRDPRSQQPLSGFPIALHVADSAASTTKYEGTTLAGGEVVFEPTLGEKGNYQLSVEATGPGTKESRSSALQVNDVASKLLLTTDKPIYQPGQTVHLRALALSPQGNTPLAQEPVTFEIEDGKGNKILKKSVKTDAYGVASDTFKIGSVVNMGTFKVRALSNNGTTEKTVSVSRYVLPKFKVGVTADKPWYLPAQKALVQLDVGYYFGKPVAGGNVTIEASTLDIGQTVFKTVQGKTDGSGKFSFELQLPQNLVGLPLDNGKALVNLRVKVADAANQEVTQDTLLSVAASQFDVVLVPESTVLVPGVENRLDLYATNPVGAPIAGAEAKIWPEGGTSTTATTDAFGHAVFFVTPTAEQSSTFNAQVTHNGQSVSSQFSFSSQVGAEHVVVRTDKAVYGVGDEVTVDVVASSPSHTVYIDWLNGGQTVDMRTLELKDGKASFKMPLDATLTGSNRVEAYIVDDTGNVVRAGSTVFVRAGGALRVELNTDKEQYEPGEEAKVTFSVKDESGAPAVAALGVQIVDEAVYGLVESKPGLLRTFFELEDKFSTPSYQLRGPQASFEELIFQGTTAADSESAEAAQQKAKAAFAALGQASLTGLSSDSWPGTQAEVVSLLQPFQAIAKERLTQVLNDAVRESIDAMANEGCAKNSYWCDGSNQPYQTVLNEKLKAKLSNIADPWGNAYRFDGLSYNGLPLKSIGPDEIASTLDDHELLFAYSELSVFGDPWYWGGGGIDAGNGFGGGAGAGGTGGSGGAGGSNTNTPETPGAEGNEPRVRKDFPETLFVQPSLITGGDGTATVTIPMADSITSWRVSTLANAMSGKLGGGTGAIKVFQDFFADIALPATLTRGDEVSFPVAVYNYLPEPQTVQLQLEPGDWYTALGPTTISVPLEAGQVTGVSVPIRVEKVGVGQLTVKAIGTKKSDAVQRMVQVVPDGKQFVQAQSGRLSPGEVSLGVNFPQDSVEGSPHLHLDVYPAFVSQMVSGMESLLQEPYGCFEQTTSTVWPNVLVRDYLKQTGQGTTEIDMKADALISAGYQRLLTFEHPGGGYSWFGTQDPAPNLSVTAFGLMEFADMAKVRDVDANMIQRTVNWILSQQKADGSWEGEMTEFFSFQTSKVRNSAFVALALASAGNNGSQVQSALSYVKQNFTSDQDDYTVGIVANAFVLAAPNDPFTTQLLTLLESRKKAKDDTFYWAAEGTQTDFYGYGQDAVVTATAIATHALLLAGGHGSTIQGAIGYLAGSRDANGNFGSTQSTIWTLRALARAAAQGTDGAVGSLEVKVDGAPFATVSLTADQSDVMRTVDLSSLATLGNHDVSLAFVGTGSISYNLVAKHNVAWAASPEQAAGPVSVTVSYDKTTLAVNDTAIASVKVINNQNVKQNMVMATVGLPPGFEVQTEDLDAYKTQQLLSNYEITGKQLILYLTSLPASGEQVFAYRLKATMPVKAEDGGASAYLYYQPLEKTAFASTTFTVNAQLGRRESVKASAGRCLGAGFRFLCGGVVWSLVHGLGRVLVLRWCAIWLNEQDGGCMSFRASWVLYAHMRPKL